ncbi:MAG TPA: hypothetical protein VH083_25845 [Myxococcales bacterium]|jgi:hypothetical protein|nr:hypothetical protein [Myxococcales bacterium]
MKANFASSLLLAVSLVAAVPARAEVGLANTVPSSVAAPTSNSPNLQDVNTAPVSTNGANPRRTGRFGWATVGIYDFGISVDVPNGAGGTFSVGGSSAYFGVSVGAALDVVQLIPDLQLSIFGNAAIAIGSDLVFPLTAGAAVHYDALPVMLFGGLGFSVVPNTASGADTGVGLAIFLMASYPVPQIMPNLSFLGQFQYHFLSNSEHLLVFDVGASIGF